MLKTYRSEKGCRKCGKIAPLPVVNKPFERSIVHETSAASIVADKIAWGMPIARQARRYGMHDLPLTEAVMLGVYMKGAELLVPIVAALKVALGKDVALLDLTHILGRRESSKSKFGEYK